MITAEMVKQLREITGAGIMDCKNALNKCQENLDKAKDYLREKGLDKAENKSGRIAAEGIVDSYIHGNGRIGVMLEVNVESDFAALNREFKSFVKDLGMQIAASKPEYVKREQVPLEVVNMQKESYRKQALQTGKQEKIIETIVKGQIEKYYRQVCLLEQHFIKDTDKTVQELLTEKIATIGENIVIRRFTRYEMGDGLAKKDENFAEEVGKQLTIGS